MKENDLLEALTKIGIETHVELRSWSESVNLLAALDAIGRRGANAIVKIDGGRNDNRAYTVVLSGGPLGEEFFRGDGSELPSLLRDAISFYLARARAGGKTFSTD